MENKIKIIILIFLLLFLTSTPAYAANPSDTFSFVLTAKSINDFNNPGPSIKKFFDNYLSLMQKFQNQFIIFYVGSGDHIYSYPPDAFNTPAPNTVSIFTNILPIFDSYVNGWANAASASLSATDTFNNLTSAKVTVADSATGLQVTKEYLFTDGHGISLHDFPVITWSWKKVGGTTIVIQFFIRNRRTGDIQTIGYYAGAKLPSYSLTSWAQIYLGSIPSEWTTERVNLKQDLLPAKETWVNHTLEKDDWEVIGYALSPMDGSYGLYNNIYALTATDINWDRFNAAASPISLSVQNGRTYPQELTYPALKNIFTAIKAEAASRGLTNLKVLDGVESGPEFSNQDWKYYQHPEAIITLPSIPNVQGPVDVINFLGNLNINTVYKYAAYPNGITSSTPITNFIADQIGAYVNAMGIDGIYSTNDFGLWNQWRPYQACTFTNGVATSCPGFNQNYADVFTNFLKRIKDTMGPGKIHIWMDTYFPTDVNYNYFSVPDTAYNYLDYIQISTFYQNTATGTSLFPNWLWKESNTFSAGPLVGKSYTFADTINSEINLTKTHPTLKLLWTAYYLDPWYGPQYTNSLNLTQWNQYKNSIHGVIIYSNNADGTLPSPAWLMPLSNSITISGDLNGDGHVNYSDYQILTTSFGNPYTIFDFNNLVTNYGK